MMLCCANLTRMTAAAGERAFSVLIGNRGNKFTFSLLFEALSAEDRERLPPMLAHGEGKGNVSLAGSIQLTYCPFCGARLSRLITSKTKRWFEQRAVEHARLHID
jgi:hypothetical protein